MSIDYRNHPNAPAMKSHAIAAESPEAHGQGDYDHPVGAAATGAEPWTDQSWEGYDEQEDATRFRGINTPEQQAVLHAEPDPVRGSRGWSPDLDTQLTWERQIDGSPPTHRGGPA